MSHLNPKLPESLIFFNGNNNQLPKYARFSLIPVTRWPSYSTG